MILSPVVFGKKHTNASFHFFCSAHIKPIVSEYFHRIVSRLFFECFTVSFCCQLKTPEHFVLASCCTTNYAHAELEDGTKLKSWSSTVQTMEEDGVCGSIYTRTNHFWTHLHGQTDVSVILYNSTPEQENTVCRSSLRHYRWFKVLWEKKYFYIFLMFGQQWTIAQPETETSPTNQLNVFKRSTGSDRRSTTPSIRILVHTGVIFWLN